MRKSTPPIAIRIILTPNAELPVREQYPVRTPRARTLRNGHVMSSWENLIYIRTYPISSEMSVHVWTSHSRMKGGAARLRGTAPQRKSATGRNSNSHAGTVLSP